MSWLGRTAAAYRGQWRALRHWKPSVGAFVFRMLLAILAAWIAFTVTIALSPGLDPSPEASVLFTVAVIGLVDFLIRPLVLALALPLGAIPVVLVGLFYRAAAFYFLLPLLGYSLGGLVGAIVAAMTYAIVSTILGGFVGMFDTESYGQRVAAQVIRDQGEPVKTDVPGVVVIQIDGLAFPLLAASIRAGTTTNLARWVRSGSHRLIEWTPQLPSQTSTSQAGLLHGNVTGIPAFRWYEKEHRRLMVSNRPDDAAEIERRLSNGEGLLANGGASIDNMFTGDAAYPRLVMSAIKGDRDKAGRARSMYYFLLNPYSLGRMIVRAIGEAIKEFYQAWQQQRRGIEPRMHRGMNFAFLRAVTNVVLRDLSVSLVSEQMLRGTPVIYVDFVDYDDVAHHVGPERIEALHSLYGIDRAIGRLQQMAADCPRPYRFVVVSDHGNSQGATWRQRHGETLEEWLRRRTGLTAAAPAVKKGPSESAGRLATVRTEAEQAGRSRSILGRRKGSDNGSSGASEAADRPADLVVCASGNLAHAYFGVAEHRMTLGEIESAYPGLVADLAATADIGIILVRTDEGSSVVIGTDGRVDLASGAVEGSDPLAQYGDGALEQLRHLDAIDHVGDLAVISSVDRGTEEVAAFEELIGNHGGLGGWQTHALVLYPADWPEPAEHLLGAPAVHFQLKRWIRAVQGESAPDAMTAEAA